MLLFFVFIAIFVSCAKNIEEELFSSDPSLKSVQVVETELPCPIVNIVVVESTVTVSWNPIQNAIGYEVIFGGDYAVSGESNTVSISLERLGLQDGNYSVKVKALANPEYWYFINSPYSDEVFFTINVEPVVPPVNEVLCSYSQGYYFGNKKPWSTPIVSVGGYTYTESEARAIWNAKNGKGGIADSKKAFCQIVAIALSGTTDPEVLDHVATAENWLFGLGKLSPSNLPTGNKDASNAAGCIGDWIDSNHCD